MSMIKLAHCTVHYVRSVSGLHSTGMAVQPVMQTDKQERNKTRNVNYKMELSGIIFELEDRKSHASVTLTHTARQPTSSGCRMPEVAVGSALIYS